MIDEDRSNWTLGQLADEVIEACELPMGCRGTIIAALGDAKAQGEAVNAEYAGARLEWMRKLLAALQYWMPDESMLTAADSGPTWDAHIKLCQSVAAILDHPAEIEPLTVPRISKWFRGSPCAIVIEFAGDITNAQIEALPRALMDALASDRQVLHSYNAHCAYCEWSREDVDGLAEGKKLAAEHAKTCKWHPMNAPRVGQRPDLYALAKADAQDWGDALNEAGWRYAEAFREIIGEPTSAAHWNNGKRVLREALLAFFTRVEKSAAPEGDKHE